MKPNFDNYGSQILYYSKFYDAVVGSNRTGFLKYLSNYPHILLEKPFKTNSSYKIIEVGAGQCEHVNFVVPDYAEYLATDINIKRLNKIECNDGTRIETKKVNAESTTFKDNEFDRLISTCLLAHLRNPEKAILEWRRVVKHKGYISIYLSTDPSLALRLFRKFTTKRKAKLFGFEGYELFIAREHTNSAQSLIDIIRYNFRTDDLKIFYKPFIFRSWYLNLVCLVQVQVNKN